MEMPSDLEAAFGYNPNLMRQGQRARVLQEKPSDYQNQHTDVTAFLAGLLGVPPDELSGSVMDPNRQRLKEIAEPAFAASTLAQAIPAIGALAKLARFSGLSGSAGNVGRGLSKQVGAIKPKGGNWLEGSVEGALNGLKNPYVDKYAAELERWGSPEQARQWVADPGDNARAINNWVDKQLTRYVKNEMATPEDPIRALAEKGVLHVRPEMLTNTPRNPVSGPHPLGKPTKLAKSDLAKEWESATDAAVARRYAENFSDAARPSWLAPGVPVYAAESPGGVSLADRAGFSHLIDELRNAANPASGLPPELLLKYSSLPQVSVPQAVERVAQINAWRAAQKAEADALRANNAATVLHKDYPEQGFKWVELKSHDALPDGWKQKPNGDFIMPDGKITSTGPSERSLQDALKYEGDTMGHCVGGYCDDVLEGKSRIFSLRDSKGQPHVTIEVKPEGLSRENAFGRDVNYENFADYLEGVRPEGNLSRLVEKRGGDFDELFTNAPEGSTKLNEFLASQYPEEAAAYAKLLSGDVPRRIVQIKGKANRAPNPEYLPFVQDFVKSGKWSDVGDLQNTGLKRLSDMGDEPMIKAAREKLGDYATQEEWDALMRGEGYARGGPVRKQVGGPFIGHVAPESNLGHDQVAPGMRKGGLSQIKECCYGR